MAIKVNITTAAYILFAVVVFILPEFFDEFWLNRIAKYLVYGMLGVAISIAWGYAGILNLGQGLFFGLGAYALAMSLKLSSATSLEQGSDKPVPDFMLWNAEPGAKTELCCINKGSFLWMPFQHEWFGVAMGIVVPTLIAGILAMVMFKKRVAGVYVSIITLASTLLVRLIVIDAQPVTNGFNGLTDLGNFTVAGYEFDPLSTETYYLVAVCLVGVLFGARALMRSRAGLILEAIRDDENRVRFLGYDIALYQTCFFAISAAMAGLAGMLFVVVSAFASPTFMNIGFSISMVVWAAVGGRNSLLGSCLGAILLNIIEASASESKLLLDGWQLIVGLIFVLVVLFLPKGLAGLVETLKERFRRRPPTGFAGLSPVATSAPGTDRD